MRRTTTLCLLALAWSLTTRAQVPYERLLNATDEPQNWLTYSGRYSSWRYSALQEINPCTVDRLALQWAFQVGALGQFETSVIAVDGVLYGTGQKNRAFALDGRTGRAIWRYQRPLPQNLQVCCGLVNRGFAILGSNLYMTTLDAHLVALDSKSGNLIWDTKAADYRLGYTFTIAPLALKNEIVVGPSGGEYGAPGFVDAYDASTGRRTWRFETIPRPGSAGHDSWSGNSWEYGGAPAWLTGSYDPKLNLIYWPTGNPAPNFFGGNRRGDNLYSNSMLALDADTGALRWYFQFTPHDVHDYDATEIPVLLDAAWQGRPRHLLVQANRNGFFYVLDRTTGEFLSATPFGRVTWATSIAQDGRPILDKSADPDRTGTAVCPGTGGVTNWFSPSYSPETRLMYIATSEECDVFTGTDQQYHIGHGFSGSAAVPTEPKKTPPGAIIAIDPLTGNLKWKFPLFSSPNGGVLSTAGGIVFAGDTTGNFIALDATTGRHLWHIQLGAGIYSTAVTYKVNDTQYVVIPSGGTLFAFALPEAGRVQTCPSK